MEKREQLPMPYGYRHSAPLWGGFYQSHVLWAWIFTPDVTTITNNPENIAESFWEMFQAAVRGDPVESRYTELFIRTGQTVPDLKTAAE